MSIAALCYEHVTVQYGHDALPAIARVSFSLEAGERVALVGLNGSGKTTLLMTAVGLIPYKGDIHVGGVRLDTRTAVEIRRRIGFLFSVPEDQLLFPKVLDDVAFALLRQGAPLDKAAAKAYEILTRLGAKDLAKHSIQHLSHGQKQLVALAGALITSPALLLLDEPSAGLDPPGKKNFAKYVEGLGSSLLLATHDLEFAKSICERFILLERGRLVMEGEDLSQVAAYWERISSPYT